MPRVAKVKYDTIFSVLKDLPIFTETGDLKKKNDQVWKQALQIMPDINLHNLYLFVYQDRRNIKTNLMNFLNIKCLVPQKIKKIKKKEPLDRYHDTWNDFNFYETLDINDEESEGDPNDLNVLLSMKNSEEYKDIIHKIGLYPFCLSYWSLQQIALWNDLINIESTVSLIVMDQIISNISGNFESGSLFLYALSVKVDNSIILLAQMMSDSTDSPEIEYFLNTWIQNNAVAPTELTVGYSNSLLNAATVAFNFCTFENYNLRCYKYLASCNLEDLPSTLIKIDIVTLIRVIDGWTCFEDVTQPVKDLYLCTIMYLSTVETMEEFSDAVVSILTLCQSPYQSEDTELRKTSLWVHLTTYTIQEMNQQYIQFVTGNTGSKSFSFYNRRQNRIINTTNNDIYHCIEQLKQQALEMCNFNNDSENIPNAYHCPNALENLIQLLVEFPAWTKIIISKECSTLVASCTTKHLDTLDEIDDPVTAPQFLIYHLEKIESLIVRGKHFINTKKLKREFYLLERKNNHAHLAQPMSRNEVSESILDESISNTIPILDFPVLKNNIFSTIHTLVDFDDCINNVLNMGLQVEQETAICKFLLDCCAEMKAYEKFFGTIASRFCSLNQNFAVSFKQIFIDCYNTVELLEKSELKNISKLFAHLLISDSISWEMLSIVKLNEKDLSTPKKNFIRILLRELTEHIGIPHLQEKLQIEKYKSAFKGLLPTSFKDAQFAASFYKSIGLKCLGDIVKENLKKGNKSTLKRSLSNSSVSSNSSCEFVLELRVSKKQSDCLRNGKRKVVLLN